MKVNGKQVRSEEGPQTATDAALQVTDTLRRIARFLREHPAVLLPSLYVYVSAIGVVYSWSLFRQFGINVMDFAEASDFILAAFREPLAVAMSFFGVIYAVFVLYAVYYLLWLIRKLQSRWRNAFSFSLPPVPAFFTVNLILFIAYTVLVNNFVAWEVSQDIKSGNGPNVVVQLENSGESAIPSQSDYEMTLVGTTQKFAFFYDHQEESTYVFPFSRIRSIVHMESNTATNATGTPTDTPK